MEINNKLLKNVCGTVLWENSNTTSQFAPQDVTLNSSNYDYYEVFYQLSLMDTRRTATGKAPKGSGTQMVFLYNTGQQSIYISRQVTYVNDTKLHFEHAYGSENNGAGGANNNRCIPIMIVGYNLGI